jgi:hypothetical protein
VKNIAKPDVLEKNIFAQICLNIMPSKYFQEWSLCFTCC